MTAGSRMTGDLHARAEAFERAYAERSGMTVEELRETGRVVIECVYGADCTEPLCDGFNSISRVAAEEDGLMILAGGEA